MPVERRISISSSSTHRQWASRSFSPVRPRRWRYLISVRPRRRSTRRLSGSVCVMESVRYAAFAAQAMEETGIRGVFGKAGGENPPGHKGIADAAPGGPVPAPHQRQGSLQGLLRGFQKGLR